MAYEKNKSELYKAIGGINEKASNYATGDNECLKLENLDFQEPGAYTSRWGFTQSASVGTTIMMDNIWQIANNLPGYTNAGANVIASNQYSLFSVSLANGNFSNIFSSAPDAASTNTWSHAESSIFSYATNGTVGGVVPAGNTLISMVKLANLGSTLGLQVGYFGLPRPVVNTFIGNRWFAGATLTGGAITPALYTYKLGLVDYFAGDDPSVIHFGPVDGVDAYPNSYLASSDKENITFYGLTLSAGATLFNPVSWALYRDNNPGPASDGTPLDSTKFYLRALAPIGATLITDVISNEVTPLPFSVTEAPTHYTLSITLGSGRPKYLETHLSRLWLATDNMVFFSEVSNPQAIPALNYFPSGSEKFNITGLRTLHSNLIVFLQKGIKRIVGDGQELADGTTNFALHDLTKEYGCLSHKAIVIFQERCWFLDEGYVAEFDGANFSIVSNRIEDTMKTVDYAACKERASALHVPERREVWFSVPTNGSNFNTLLVYDYVANAWTTFKGIEATCLNKLYTSTSAKQLNTPKYFFGTTLGQLNYFDKTLTTDNGVGFTCLVKGKFHNEGGNSVQKLFRRVFLDGPANGVTLAVGLNFYADHATTTIGLTLSAYVGTTYQYRCDFGISAKSCSVEFVHATVDSQFKIYGYTMETRFLRKV